jgi:molybdopterin converting factor small subunit
VRAYTNGQSEVTVSGSNISDVLTDLTTQFPALKPHLFNEGGDLRPFVNLFVGENNIKDLQGVETPIQDDQKIMLIPSIAGGVYVG